MSGARGGVRRARRPRQAGRRSARGRRDRRGQGVLGGRRSQGAAGDDARADLGLPRRAQSPDERGRGVPAAGDRGDQRRGVRRRPRAGAGLRHPHRRRQRRDGADRGAAGHHPGRGRHAAAGAHRGRRRRQGADPDRAPRAARSAPTRWASCRTSCPAENLADAAAKLADEIAAAGPLAVAAAKRAIDEGAALPLADGAGAGGGVLRGGAGQRRSQRGPGRVRREAAARVQRTSRRSRQCHAATTSRRASDKAQARRRAQVPREQRRRGQAVLPRADRAAVRRRRQGLRRGRPARQRDRARSARRRRRHRHRARARPPGRDHGQRLDGQGRARGARAPSRRSSASRRRRAGCGCRSSTWSIRRARASPIRSTCSRGGATRAASSPTR